MVMSWVWMALIAAAMLAAAVNGNGSALAPAALAGAQRGVELAVSILGPMCLWSGVGRALEAGGITGLLSRVLQPVLGRLFPETRRDREAADALSANVCANLLGLGNAATPMGIRAARRLQQLGGGEAASDSLCRLIVLNTASIQLLPTGVAAVRSALGSGTPFDILPAVWLASVLSAAAGLTAAWTLGKLWR